MKPPFDRQNDCNRDVEWKSRSGRKPPLREGGITRVPVHAMVNAANSALAGGPELVGEIDVLAGI